jgi:membrane-bound ClpP family serine protease
MNKFEIITEKALMYVVSAIGVAAFISTFWGAWWHIGTGTICLLLYLVLKHDLKKEAQNEL